MTPRHSDGSLVVTTRLSASLTQLELFLYDGSGWIRGLTQYAYRLMDGSSIEGWDPADLVASALERAARYPDLSKQAVKYWVRTRYLNLKRIQNRQIPAGIDVWIDTTAEHTPEDLPELVHAWLYERVPDPFIRSAIRSIATGLTPVEAADRFGVSRTEIYRTLENLRKDVSWL